jgi:hypothetical protein
MYIVILVDSEHLRNETIFLLWRNIAMLLIGIVRSRVCFGATDYVSG